MALFLKGPPVAVVPMLMLYKVLCREEDQKYILVNKIILIFMLLLLSLYILHSFTPGCTRRPRFLSFKIYNRAPAFIWPDGRFCMGG